MWAQTNCSLDLRLVFVFDLTELPLHEEPKMNLFLLYCFRNNRTMQTEKKK